MDGAARAVVLTAEQQLWACALEVEKQHGRDAWMFAKMRIEDLRAVGDAEAVKTWRVIQRHIIALRNGSRAPRQ